MTDVETMTDLAASSEKYCDEDTASASASDSDKCSSDEDDSSYDDSDDDDDCSWSSEMEAVEAAILEQTRTGILQQMESPAMKAIMQSGTETQEDSHHNLMGGLLNLRDRMKNCEANAYMQQTVPETVPDTVENPNAATKPDDFLQQQLLEGISAKSFPSETWHDYFQEMHPEHIEAYTKEIVEAIRNDEYDVLRDHLRAGHTLQCCNSHGESIVHLCCRRGSTEMLQFLLEEAQVSIRIRDDKGRTPLHDACWTDRPNFDLIYRLLQSSPELLFVQDHRGHTPMTYVPRKRWGEWCDFLQKHRVFLRASVRSLRFDRAKFLVRNYMPCLKHF